MSYLNNYVYRGARAMVILHDQHMRSCLDVWKEAKAKNISLPQTEDKDYKSLEHLLHHLFRAARGYMVWMCGQLKLPDPNINEAPSIENVESEADAYLEHLLEKWETPLADVATERYNEMFTTTWGMELCVEAMLEHAVMHPIRHEFQLKELMK